ncbi:TVP38/TMEM64 family protein [Halosimplex aquaticum]|uniref:TVP38/TMEM64 family protein n=1 Tax=Halosimplex aquaticum TaxID=3026162 RepID=A0ABD5XWW7_9EURY|nr:VTT domain-containing protein [Halosimplex aquaticum]
MAVSRATRRQFGSLGAVGAALAAAAVVFSPSAVLDSIAGLSAHPWRFVATLAVLYLVRPFLLWPVSALSLTVGYVLGATYGIPVAIAGTLLSNTTPFLLARYARTDRGVVGLTTRTSDRIVEATGELRGVVAARLAPLPADVVSSGAGLSDVSLRAYLLGTLVGESPWIAAEVIAGASMHTLSVHGLRHSLALFAAATSLSALLIARPAYRFVRDEYDLGV